MRAQPITHRLNRTTLRRQLPGLAAVFGGGLVGSAARAGIGSWLPTPVGHFPIGVLVINVTGSFILGLFLARRELAITSRWSLQFWAIGVLGSFTTFSAFSLDVFRLLTQGRPLTFAGYVAASLVGGLLAAAMGQRVGRVVG
ncbi:MAG: CrcB family protein [Acidimicrobiia bacterium]